MRIYVLSNNVVKKKIALLEPYLQETRQICYIWSVNGLLQIENNKIYKIKIKDVPTKKTLLGAFPATIDESEFIRKEECYQILPIAHKEYTTLKIYRVKGSTLTNPKGSALTNPIDAETHNPSTDPSTNPTPNPSQNPSTNHSETPTASGIALEWVLEYKNGELHDNYFSLPVNEDIHSLKHKADLSEFMNI
jgi:hypothetical protein